MDDLAEPTDSLGVEFVLAEPGTTAPCCPHGPTLLFEKLGKAGERGRRFYACSACRDRKDCSFFQWEDEKVSEARLAARKAENESKRPRFTQQEYASRFRQFVSLPVDEKKFCEDCQTLLLPAELAAHSAHGCRPVTAAQLRRPSELLRPLDNKKSNAQYLFSGRTARFLLDTLAGLGYRKLLCVGTPRLHEMIKLRNLERKDETMKSLLLDIDFRYAQFYSPDEFCHYNMFNHHCFDAETSSGVLRDFLTQSAEGELVMVTDPPFGGLVEPLARSFTQISQTWRELQTPGARRTEIPMIWIFPYFFEPRILKFFPSFTMLDYQVDYDNHPLYKQGKRGRKQSPVRLFTNIPPRDVVLPEEEGYRFCSLCERYVGSLNKHCNKCSSCPSKDGREWRHCSVCDKCVKPSWRHCRSCDRCALPDHPCNRSAGAAGCFSCGSLEHKRKTCPSNSTRRFSGSKHLKAKGQKTRGAARRAKNVNR